MIRLNATADVLRLQSSAAIALAYAVTATDVTGATVTDASTSGTNSDSVKNNIITAPSADHRKDVSKITVSNANANTQPRVKVYSYVATVETVLADVVLLNGQTLKYEGGDWTVVPTNDPTAAGVFTRAEADAAYATAAQGAEADAAAALFTTVGVASGYKVARGSTDLDGTNPTPVATGLTTVVAFAPVLKGTAAPGVGTSVLTADIAGAAGNVDVYAWKVTSNSNPTLIASTGTETFYWVAIGT